MIFGDLHFSLLWVLHVNIFNFILSFFDLRRWIEDFFVRWTLIPTPGEKYWEYKEIFPHIFFSRLFCFSFNKIAFRRFPCAKWSFEACFWKKSSKEDSQGEGYTVKFFFQSISWNTNLPLIWQCILTLNSD